MSTENATDELDNPNEMQPADLNFLARRVAGELSLTTREEFEAITARAWEMIEANGAVWSSDGRNQPL